MKFLPDGVRTLAQGALPGGQRFSIDAQHYRFQGHIYLSLSVGTRSGGGSGFTPAQAPGPIAFTGFGECSHPSVLLLYGLLRVAGDVVAVSSRRHSYPLSRVAMPSHLGTRGVLVYGQALTPAALIVKSATGAVVKSVRLGGPNVPCPRGGGSFSTMELIQR